MRLSAPAKINLHLRIGQALPSGFHPLMSWFVTVGLFDTLICEHDATGKLSLVCDDATHHPGGIPIDERNLIIKAAGLLRTEPAWAADASGELASGTIPRGARFELQKRIPVGGGLGGGSSNAACAIMVLDHLWNLRMSFDRMCEAAAELGSDVPFFIHAARGANSCLCTGRGEIVRPIESPAPRWALLIFPDIAVSTASVYRRFDELELGKATTFEDEPDWREWSRLSAEQLLPRLVNDLETPAFEMNQNLKRLAWDTQQRLERIVRMSGSGSTLFTLYDDESAARQAAKKLSERCEVVSIAPKIPDDRKVV